MKLDGFAARRRLTSRGEFVATNVGGVALTARAGERRGRTQVRWSRPIGESAIAASVGILSLLASIVSLRLPLKQLSGLWQTNIGAGWTNSDLVSQYGIDRAIEQNGWLGVNPFLGFPSVQDASHFPNADVLGLLEIKLLLHAGANAVSAANLMFVFSFPLIGALTYLAFRFVGVRRTLAALLSLGFAILPWHYYRLTHLFLANYWILAVLLVWMAIVLSLVPLRPWLSSRVTVVIGFSTAVLIGLNEPYYAIFGCILAGLGFLARLTVRQQPIRLWLRLAMLLVVPVVMGSVVLAQRLAREVPAMAASAERDLYQQYSYGGHLTSLLVPSEGSLAGRLAPSVILQDALRNPYPTGIGEGLAHWNSLTAVAFAVALGLAMYSVLSGAAGWTTTESLRSRASVWAGLVVVALVLFVTTGFGLAIGAFVTPQIRAWGRLSIAIALLSLTVLGLLVSSAHDRWNRSGARRWVYPTLVIVVAVLALEALTFQGKVRADVESPAALSAYNASADEALGRSCPVLSMPWIRFPEWESETGTSTYDQLLPYIYSDKRKYSFGAYPSQLGSQWAASLPADVGELAQRAKATGFCAIQLDTGALKEPKPVLDSYIAYMGGPVASALNRWYLFDLVGVSVPKGTRPLNDELDVRIGKGFYPAEAMGDSEVRWLAQRVGQFVVGNPTSAPRPVQLDFDLRAAPCAESTTVEIKVNGELAQPASVSPGSEEPTRLSVPITMDPKSVLHVDVVQTSPLCADVSANRLTGAGVSLTVESPGSIAK